jgi:hypothetical protein
MRYNMKEYWAVDIQIRVFLTSTLDGGERLDPRPGRFNRGVIFTGTH